MGNVSISLTDARDVLFRALFSVIFLGLGAEHIFSDDLIQELMPGWVPYPRLVSMTCGLWLVFWGAHILVGWRLRRAAYALGLFLIVVTIVVHLPGVLVMPVKIDASCQRLWDILQRSNLVKNLCLFGSCIHFIDYRVGRYSLEAIRNVRGS